MSLETVKEIIGKAVIDTDFRALLEGDPDKALKGYQLTGEERASLEGLTADKFDAIASELDDRLSRASLGNFFGDLFSWVWDTDPVSQNVVPESSDGGGRAPDIDAHNYHIVDAPNYGIVSDELIQKNLPEGSDGGGAAPPIIDAHNYDIIDAPNYGIVDVPNYDIVGEDGIVRPAEFSDGGGGSPAVIEASNYDGIVGGGRETPIIDSSNYHIVGDGIIRPATPDAPNYEIVGDGIIRPAEFSDGGTFQPPGDVAPPDDGVPAPTVDAADDQQGLLLPAVQQVREAAPATPVSDGELVQVQGDDIVGAENPVQDGVPDAPDSDEPGLQSVPVTSEVVATTDNVPSADNFTPVRSEDVAGGGGEIAEAGIVPDGGAESTAGSGPETTATP